MDFSSCSIFPVSSHLNDEFSSMGNRSSGGSWSPCLLNWDFDHGGDREQGHDFSHLDPIDLLPSDPFGMNLNTTFTAALASWWIRDHGISLDDYGFGGDYLVSSFSDYGYGGWLPLYESQFNAGTLSDFGSEAQDWGFTQAADRGESSNPNQMEEACDRGEEDYPHDALIYSLAYLGVRDLLSVEMVCRSLRNTVQSDSLLWRCIHIESPLSERMTDDDLFRLTSRAQGNLHYLSLVGCMHITDDGLKRVLETNPRLKKLRIPGCVRLSLEGLINNLKALKSSAMLGITHLRLGKLFGVTSENYDELKLLLGVDRLEQSNARKPRFYHHGPHSLAFDDDRPLDIEMCSLCQKLKLVFDCPSEGCQEKPEECRACDICIARCIQCGRCIKNCEYEETFLLENLCSSCWKETPTPAA
ncbi:RNI-like protein [Dioscorea alata]|uniref:RNI-like protein n=1 Tax=Dioscorea alata TaxID=55571 RepID=A0ACB7VB70_DIOAL|nr:RNI-like protein [Dioscorea alata]